MAGTGQEAKEGSIQFLTFLLTSHIKRLVCFAKQDPGKAREKS